MGVLPVFCLEQAESVAKKKPNWTVGEFEIGKTRNYTVANSVAGRYIPRPLIATSSQPDRMFSKINSPNATSEA